MLFNIVITKMKLNVRNKRYDIIVNFTGVKIPSKRPTFIYNFMYLSNLS